MKETYDVILVDDHLMFRLGMKKILEASEDINVVGEASDGQELLSLLNQVSPQMVILDISMPVWSLRNGDWSQSNGDWDGHGAGIHLYQVFMIASIFNVPL